MRVLCLLILSALLPSTSRADTPKAMSLLEASQFDAALTHEDFILIQAQEQTKEAVRPFEEVVTKLCAKFSINRAELNKTVFIDVKTGAITRKSPPKETPQKPEIPKTPASTKPATPKTVQPPQQSKPAAPDGAAK